MTASSLSTLVLGMLLVGVTARSTPGNPHDPESRKRIVVSDMLVEYI